MSVMDATTPQRRWFYPTPGWLALGLLAVEGILFLSERSHWFAFNEHKGWTVLIALAGVGVALVLMLLWFAVALVCHWRFQFSIRSLLVLTVAVALPCSWLAAAMKEARRQHDAVEAIGGLVFYDYLGTTRRTASTGMAAGSSRGRLLREGRLFSFEWRQRRG